MRFDVSSPSPYVGGGSLLRGALSRTLLAFLVIAIAIHLLVGRQVTDRYRTFLEFHAEFVAEALIEQELVGQEVLDGPMGADLRVDLTDFIRRFVVVGDVRGLSIWRPDGTVVLSSEPSHVGTRDASIAPLLEGVVVGGPRTFAVDPDDPTGLDPADDAVEAIESYVPIDVAGRPAVVEVHQDLGPTLEAAGDFVRTLDIILVLGLAALLGLMVPISRRAAGRLERQNTELHRLLETEAETVARLEELNAAKDRFLTAISHELRTPLTMVKGGAETLAHRGDALPPEVRDRVVGVIAAQADRLDVLLQELLDLDRLLRGTVEARMETTDLGELTRRVLAAVELDGDVTCEVPSVGVDVDVAQVERIVENLLVNAARHTPEGRRIAITAERVSDVVVLCVDDDGPGVPDALKLHVLEPFVQGPTLHPESPGTGIGLAVADRFARLNGGVLEIRDSVLGGASVRVSLPLSSAHPEAASRGPAAEPQDVRVP